MGTIQEMAQRIVAECDPEKVILFGSCARQEATKRSDVDFLVIANDMRPKPKRSAPLYSLLRDFHVSKDILVYTPQEVEDYAPLRASLIHRALTEGIVLYEKQG